MDKKTLLAFLLIAVVLIFMPKYMDLVSPPVDNSDNDSTLTVPERSARAVETPTPMPIETTRTATSQPVRGSVQSLADEKEIEVETNLYSAIINNRNGGSISSFKLKKYKMQDSLLVQLVTSFNKNNLLFESVSIDGVPLILDAPWKISRTKMSIGATDRPESLTFKTNVLGETISKKLTFYPDSYKIDIDFDLSGISDKISQGYYTFSWNGGLPPTEKNVKDDLFYYKGYVYQGDDASSVKLKKNKTLDEKYRGSTGWVASRNKYFISALIPNGGAVGATIGGLFEAETPEFDIALQRQVSSNNSFSLYLGPLDAGHIETLNVGLENAMTLGWSLIRPIGRGVLALLTAMHKIIPNYGIVLIIFAILVKIVVYPLTRKSYQSMRKMSTIQPKLAELKEKYKADPQKLNKATMQMYKEEGVNPMGGCLPLLIQMPLLVALFQVFRSTIELRGEPFMLWITDLSAPDTLLEIGGFPLNVLPIVMGISMLLQQKLTPTTAQAGQQKNMMYFMNVFFIFIFYNFPSGLNLYYTLFNVLTILQQKYLTPHDQPAPQPVKVKAKKK